MASDSLFVVRLNNGQLAGTSVADIRGMLDRARASRSKARVVFHVGDGLIDDAEGQRVADPVAWEAAVVERTDRRRAFRRLEAATLG